MSSHDFIDFCLQTTSSISEKLRCRSPFRSLPSSPIRRTLTQMRCRTVAVHRRWYRSLWAPTTLAIESPTDLFVASHWLERSSCRFAVTLLVFSRADHSTSQVLAIFSCGFYHNFYWRFASKSLHVSLRPPLIGSTPWRQTPRLVMHVFSKYSYTLLSKHASSCSAIRPNYSINGLHIHRGLG